MSSHHRMISIESQGRIYHIQGCPYSVRIQEKNQIILLKHEAKQMGYRPCKCCNRETFRYRWEQSMARSFAISNHMQLQEINKHLYVKTEIGIWKLVYMPEAEKFILYHGNAVCQNTPIDKAHKARYHRQKDMKKAETVMDVLSYIRSHDRYKKCVQEAGGNELAVKIDRKYEKQRSNRLRRQSARRIDSLFAMIERQNPEYKQLSMR